MKLLMFSARNIDYILFRFFIKVNGKTGSFHYMCHESKMSELDHHVSRIKKQIAKMIANGDKVEEVLAQDIGINKAKAEYVEL